MLQLKSSSLRPDQLPDTQLLKLTEESDKQRESAAGITVGIWLRAVALLIILNGVAQPFEFIECGLKFRVCHVLFSW